MKGDITEPVRYATFATAYLAGLLASVALGMWLVSVGFWPVTLVLGVVSIWCLVYIPIRYIGGDDA